MNVTNNLQKAIVGALLFGGIALAGLTSGIAQASTQPIDPSINSSDFNIPLVECTQCQQTLPGRPEVHPNGGNKGGSQGSGLPGRPEVRPNGANKYDSDHKP
ncbi:hypothetical protein GGC64_001152 [Mycobacterium sp. OAS707]|uniref:hypothetical protein n=1 Tax=Mycobacterium sp. OAS707 TaxID=2663822 RepID=UPI00178901BC|nr:hypothetical protein [Mycobacterium sp. OAS707]MBE1547144.1 hypothetical protein [Mycobacterium sp. OAS707]